VTAGAVAPRIVPAKISLRHGLNAAGVAFTRRTGQHAPYPAIVLASGMLPDKRGLKHII